MTDILASGFLQATVISLAAIGSLALAVVYTPPQPVKAECEKPMYLPTAEDAPSYSWQWPLQETYEDTPRRHRRRG